MSILAGNSDFDLAKSLFLESNALELAQLQATLNQAMGPGVDFADLYFQHCRLESWSLEESLVKSGSYSVDVGAGLRTVSADKSALAYVDQLDQAHLMQAAEATRAIGRQGQAGVFKAADTCQRYPLYYKGVDSLAQMQDKEKIALLDRVDRWARAADLRVQEVIASLMGCHEVVLVMRSDGHLAADVRPLVRFSVQVIVEENGRRESGSSGGGGRYAYADFSDANLKHYVRQAVDQALTNLQAEDAPAGMIPVVLGSGWPGVLLHEAVGHGLEGDFNRKGSSVFSNCVGKKVAAAGVTVLDNGTLENRRGSLNIDDEGTPTQCTTLIEDGILRGYMQDRLNASLMKESSTGNGRRESYAALPMPRMTNTYMANGASDPEEIIASVKYGLYAKNFRGGQVDITNGKFVFSASEAFLIENGKVTRPVKGATLIGCGSEVLHQVSMIGNDLALDDGIGVCGKDGQSVPVGVGQPTLKIDSLTVGGTSQA